MKYLMILVLQLTILTIGKAQEKTIRPLNINIKLGLIPFTPGTNIELYYHINTFHAIGLESNSFISKPDLSDPDKGKGIINLNFPFSDYKQDTRSYFVKYQYVPKSDTPSYFQFSFTGGLGISNFNKIIGYKKITSGGGFASFSWTNHKEIYKEHILPSGMVGFNISKLKRSVGYFTGLDLYFSREQMMPLLKIGLQINIFKQPSLISDK